MNSQKVILGVLAGLAAGALLGILFAPDKGTSTRKKISDKSSDYADAIKNKFNEFVDNITEKFDSAKETVKDDIEKGKAKAEEMKRDVKSAMS